MDFKSFEPLYSERHRPWSVYYRGFIVYMQYIRKHFVVDVFGELKT